MDSLYIVMPAYNEEANIEQVVRDWYPLLNGKSPDSRLVIADNGSTDCTHTILLYLQKEYPQLDILENTGKQHGPKVIALYDYAIKNRIDYVFQTDSDGQTNPDEFETFWNMRTQYDGIFGMDLCQYLGHKKLNFSPSITYAERIISYAARASSSTC